MTGCIRIQSSTRIRGLGSPAPGIVIKIGAQIGQRLQSGDVLLALEAMKTETNVTAPAAGKIAAFPVSKGESVQAGPAVVEFE